MSESIENRRDYEQVSTSILKLLLMLELYVEKQMFQRNPVSWGY